MSELSPLSKADVRAEAGPDTLNNLVGLDARSARRCRAFQLVAVVQRRSIAICASIMMPLRSAAITNSRIADCQ